MCRSPLILSTLLLAMIPHLADAATLHVPADQPTIQAAIDAAASGDSILIAAGTYTDHDDTFLSLTNKSLSIIGAGSSQTMIQRITSSSTPVLRIQGGDGESLVEGLTLNGAGTPYLKFAVNISGQGAVFRDFVVEGFTYGSPPFDALYSDSYAFKASDVGPLRFIDCRFSGNLSSGSTISIVNSISSPVLFENVDFIGNLVHVGTVSLIECEAVFEDCRFFDNTAEISYFQLEEWITYYPGKAAALYLNKSAVDLSACVFARNRAYGASDSPPSSGWGAIVARSYPDESLELTIEGCTFWRNWAEVVDVPMGAAITVVGEGASHMEIRRTIIADSFGGGGIYVEAVGSQALECNDICGNTDGDYLGVIPDPTGTNGNISTDPLFCDAENWDYTLFNNSPCLPANNDCGLLMGALGQGCHDGTPAEEPPLPASHALFQNHPNPFNPTTTIAFALPEAARVDLSVFDVTGRRVATLLDDDPREAGAHGVIWRGSDDAGRALAGGVYFYRLQAGDYLATKKMLLLK